MKKAKLLAVAGLCLLAAPLINAEEVAATLTVAQAIKSGLSDVSFAIIVGFVIQGIFNN